MPYNRTRQLPTHQEQSPKLTSINWVGTALINREVYCASTTCAGTEFSKQIMCCTT